MEGRVDLGTVPKDAYHSVFFVKNAETIHSVGSILGPLAPQASMLPLDYYDLRTISTTNFISSIHPL